MSGVSGAAGVLLPAQLVRQPLPVRHPDQAVPARPALAVLPQHLLRQEADQGGGRVGQLAPAAQHLLDRPAAADAAAEQRRGGAGARAAALVQRRPRGQQQQQPLQGLAAPHAQFNHSAAHDQRAGDAAAARRRAERAAARSAQRPRALHQQQRVKWIMAWTKRCVCADVETPRFSSPLILLRSTTCAKLPSLHPLLHAPKTYPLFYCRNFHFILYVLTF